MYQIRRNTFETNSSSTHSMVITTKSEMEAWENNEVYYIRYGGYSLPEEWKKKQFMPVSVAHELFDEAFAEVKEDYYNDFDYFIKDTYDLCTYDDWYEDYEQDSTTYTTPSGDVIKIRCAYGYDG